MHGPAFYVPRVYTKWLPIWFLLRGKNCHPLSHLATLPLLLHPFACLVMLMEACICHSPERARYDGLGAKQDVGGLYSFMATHSLKWRPMRRRCSRLEADGAPACARRPLHNARGPRVRCISVTAAHAIREVACENISRIFQ